MTESQPLPEPPTSTAETAPDSVPEGTRPGEMTLVWRLTLMLGWIAAFFAYAAVWQASVQLGIATWWVGPRSQPEPVYIRMIPFILAIAAILMAVYNVRRLDRLSGILALVSVLIALPDFSRSVGLAVVELLISGAMVVLSAASTTGRYRVAPAPRGAAVVSDFAPPAPPGSTSSWAPTTRSAPSASTETIVESESS